MALVVLLWLVSPIAGLVFFLIYSAWHFGETDLIEWQRSNAGLSFLWGTLLLGIVLLSHIEEVNTMMSYMNVPAWPVEAGLAASLVNMMLFLGFMCAFWFRSAAWALSLIALALGTQFLWY